MPATLSVLTVCTPDTVTMYRTTMAGPLDSIPVLFTEIRTEASTAEIAIWTIAVCTLAYATALVAVRRNRRRGAASDSSTVGWDAVRVAALVSMFTILAVQVATSGWLTGADAATLGWFVAHRSPAVTTTAVVVTTVGGPAGTAMIGVLAAAALSWRRRSLLPGAFLIVTVGAAAIASTVVKNILDRARPPAVTQLVAETDFSYPSGHVTGIVALVGALFVVLGTAHRSAVRTAIAVLAAAVVVTIVAVTRLYLGVHWLSDVLGGALLGGVVVVAASLILHAVAARRTAASQGPSASGKDQRFAATTA